MPLAQDLQTIETMTDIGRLAAAFFGADDHRSAPFSGAGSALPSWMQTNAPAPNALPAAEVLSAAHYFDWLLEVPPAPSGGAPALVQPEWLPLSTIAVQAAALQPVAQLQELPAWLLEDTPAASGRHRPEQLVPNAVPAAAQAPPAAEPAAAAPAASTAADNQQLAHAHALLQAGNLSAALPIYGALVEGGQLLPAVIADLQALPQPAHPATRQLLHILGDAHMKNGEIQAALQCYQSALRQPNS
jgi:tetratricopeptide (TPR) repeat protein